jgi:hypothetical protein
MEGAGSSIPNRRDGEICGDGVVGCAGRGDDAVDGQQ